MRVIVKQTIIVKEAQFVLLNKRREERQLKVDFGPEEADFRMQAFVLLLLLICSVIDNGWVLNQFTIVTSHTDSHCTVAQAFK